MKTNTGKTPKILITVLLAVLVLALSACTRVHPVEGRVTQLVDVTIRQEQMNDLVGRDYSDTDSPCNLLDDVTRIELHDGYIRFMGTNDLPGGDEVSGSYDLNLTAEDGALKAEIVAVDFPGVELTDSCIVEANQELEDELTHMLNDSDQEVIFKEVKVEEGVLRMKIQVNIDL